MKVRVAIGLVIVITSLLLILHFKQAPSAPVAYSNAFYFPEGMELSNESISQATLFNLVNTSTSVITGNVTYYRQFEGTSFTRPVVLPVGLKPVDIDPSAVIGQHEIFATAFHLSSSQVTIWRAIGRIDRHNAVIGVEYSRPLSISQRAQAFTFPHLNGLNDAYVLVQNPNPSLLGLTTTVNGYHVALGTIPAYGRRTIAINTIQDSAAKLGFTSGSVIVSAVQGQVLAEEVVYSGAPGKGSDQPQVAIYDGPSVSAHYLYRAKNGEALPVSIATTPAVIPGTVQTPSPTPLALGMFIERDTTLLSTTNGGESSTFAPSTQSSPLLTTVNWAVSVWKSHTLILSSAKVHAPITLATLIRIVQSHDRIQPTIICACGPPYFGGHVAKSG